MSDFDVAIATELNSSWNASRAGIVEPLFFSGDYQQLPTKRSNNTCYIYNLREIDLQPAIFTGKAAWRTRHVNIEVYAANESDLSKYFNEIWLILTSKSITSGHWLCSSIETSKQHGHYCFIVGVTELKYIVVGVYN